MWASTDPASKVTAKADGTYSLEVTHAGTFGITAGYTGTDGNYKTSDEKTFKTADKTIDGENIALNYGHKTTLIGNVFTLGDPGLIYINGATVTIRVEGRVIGSTTAAGGNAEYSITFTHPGRFTATGSFPGFQDQIARFSRTMEDSERFRNGFDLQP